MLSIERWQTCYIRSHQNCLHSVQSLVQPLVCRHEQSSVGLLDCGGEKRVQVLVRWRHGLQVWPLIFHFLGKRKSARSLLICFPGPFNDQRSGRIIPLSLSLGPANGLLFGHSIIKNFFISNMWSDHTWPSVVMYSPKLAGNMDPLTWRRSPSELTVPERQWSTYTSTRKKLWWFTRTSSARGHWGSIGGPSSWPMNPSLNLHRNSKNWRMEIKTKTRSIL